MSKVSEDEIKKQVKNFFIKFFTLKENQFTEDYFVECFYGAKIRLAPRDVVVFLYALEKEFNFVICNDDILLGKFDNLLNVVNIVYKNKGITQNAKEETI